MLTGAGATGGEDGSGLRRRAGTSGGGGSPGAAPPSSSRGGPAPDSMVGEILAFARRRGWRVNLRPIAEWQTLGWLLALVPALVLLRRMWLGVAGLGAWLQAVAEAQEIAQREHLAAAYAGRQARLERMHHPPQPEFDF